MSTSLTLPTEFGGLPGSVIDDAQNTAEAMLPANLVSAVGQARAEEALVAATAHVLTVTRAGTGEDLRAAPTGWSGSAYGGQVEAILRQHYKPTGRTRGFPMTSTEA